ncbi:MAG: tetratricopeptide repeat protein [Candidatus Cloacimonetes bacterium]|nr:tetratricopeptide repeat protein [Candidatus Cloacimonadota bacterium]MDD2211320.1 tetratricopeptide repeat protein [Candidatus Cloacimonadota bacterium]MDY0298843.1 tetratricopeptide repeat protein [Candidatus Cloacimonadaceae bacterium]
MNRLLLIAMVALLLISACSVNTGMPQPSQVVENYSGLVTKVAILPLKTMDARSRNVRKILTVRDFDYVFSAYPQYELLDMEFVADEFEVLGIPNVDDMELEEMNELAELTDANVIVLGNIASLRADLFTLSLRFYSARTNELRQVNFNVPNIKEQRWESLNKNLMAELDRFITNEVEKIFNVAANFYAGGNYQEAENQLKVTIGLDPEKIDAYYYLGATYYKTEQYSLAETNFNKALELNPEHYQTLVMMNEMYEKTGEKMKRIGVMEKIAATKDDADLWLVIGNLYAEEQDYESAENALNNALSLNDDNPRVKVRLAFLLYDQGRYNDALPYLESANETFPENDLISRRLAVSYQRSGRMADAIANYEGLIRLNPNNTQAYLNVVSLYRNQASETTDETIKQEMNNKAIETMNQLIRIQPDNALAYLNLASIYLAMGNNDLAETNANAAIERDPSLYQSYVIMATINQSKGTNEYNRFADLERLAADAVGRQATTLSRQRDAAKSNANRYFRNAVDQLNTARSLTAEPDILNDIQNRLKSLSNLVSQTQGY